MVVEAKADADRGALADRLRAALAPLDRVRWRQDLEEDRKRLSALLSAALQVMEEKRITSLFVCDEVITFRSGHGGAQGWHDVRPDLTALFPASTYPGVTNALGVSTLELDVGCSRSRSCSRANRASSR